MQGFEKGTPVGKFFIEITLSTFEHPFELIGINLNFKKKNNYV